MREVLIRFARICRLGCGEHNEKDGFEEKKMYEREACTPMNTFAETQRVVSSAAAMGDLQWTSAERARITERRGGGHEESHLVQPQVRRACVLLLSCSSSEMKFEAA